MSEWINVDDRMPGILVPVLAYSNSATCHINYRRRDCVGNSVWAEVYDVTHWMPLPEPPKEE